MTTEAIRTGKPRPAIGLFAQLCRSLAKGYERSRQRRALASLSEFQLQDIGLTRHDVARESTKSFWQV